LVDYRVRATKEIIDMLRGHYGRQIFKTEIRVNVRLSEAPSFGKTIFDYDKTSTGAESYRNLAIEVTQRCQKNKDGNK
jgi:chromosome partitioning protein